jgi:hypothetical protein
MRAWDMVCQAMELSRIRATRLKVRPRLAREKAARLSGDAKTAAARIL